MGTKHTLPTDQPPTTRVLAMPADTNSAGDIFGGWLLSQVDIAGSILAHKTAKKRMVTVSLNHCQFIKPVYVGDVVSSFASIEKIGNTSMTLRVLVFAERDYNLHETHLVAEAELTYVAIDSQGKPTKIKG